jgi:hypothetical protein
MTNLKFISDKEEEFCRSVFIKTKPCERCGVWDRNVLDLDTGNAYHPNINCILFLPPGRDRDKIVAEILGLQGVGYYRRESWTNTRRIACEKNDIDLTDTMPLVPSLYYQPKKIAMPGESPYLFAVPPYSTQSDSALLAIETWRVQKTGRLYNIYSPRTKIPYWGTLLAETGEVDVTNESESLADTITMAIIRSHFYKSRKGKKYESDKS